MNITESINFNKLQEENEKLKKELAEKDKDIDRLKNFIQIGGCHQHIQKYIDNLEKEIEELESKQLYKEDFDEYCQYVNGRRKDTYIIKYKSLYKKLPSKDVK